MSGRVPPAFVEDEPDRRPRARAGNWSGCCAPAPASPPKPLSSTPSLLARRQRVRRGALGRRSSLNARYQQPPERARSCRCRRQPRSPNAAFAPATPDRSMHLRNEGVRVGMCERISSATNRRGRAQGPSDRLAQGPAFRPQRNSDARGLNHVQQTQRHATCAAQRCGAAR